MSNFPIAIAFVYADCVHGTAASSIEFNGYDKRAKFFMMSEIAYWSLITGRRVYFTQGLSAKASDTYWLHDLVKCDLIMRWGSSWVGF